MSTLNLHDCISLKAYLIWEQEGRPEGRESEHWLRAESDVLGAVGPEKKSRKTTTKKTRKKTANGGKTQASRANGTKKKSVAADDLTRIKGVGKVIAEKLNGIGVKTFAQVADWKAKDIGEIDQKLAFKGRIRREDWVSQAKVLAGGGESTLH